MVTHFEKFREDVLTHISRTLGSDVTVTIHKVIKTNDVELFGLNIMDKGSNICPTIYLDNYFSHYKYCEMTFDEIIEEILDIYKHHRNPEHFDISFFEDFEKVKDRIAYKLINTKQNQKLLEDTPSVKFLDLSIVFYYYFDSTACGSASILIKNDHINMWNVDIDTLFSTAKANTPKLFPHTLENIMEILAGTRFSPEEIKCLIDSEPPMYVLSNTLRFHGSISLLYEGVLKEFADRIGRNLYILPSSVHEIILVPTDDATDIKNFTDMVIEVNAHEVPKEERLSNHAYYYNRKEDKIELGGNY